MKNIIIAIIFAMLLSYSFGQGAILEGNNLEFMDLRNNDTIIAAIYSGTKMSNSSLIFFKSQYTSTNDSIIIKKENSIHDKTVTIFETKNNNDSDYIKISFASVNLYSQGNLRITLIDSDGNCMEHIFLQLDNSIRLNIAQVSEIEFRITSYNTSFTRVLTRNEFQGKKFIIRSHYIMPLSNDISFVMRKQSDTAALLIGPILQNYKDLNRKLWFKRIMCNWPWRWSFKKVHWFDPLEEYLIKTNSDFRYFFYD